MADFGKLKATLDLDIQKFSTKMKAASKNVTDFKNKITETAKEGYMSSASEAVTKAADSVTGTDTSTTSVKDTSGDEAIAAANKKAAAAATAIEAKSKEKDAVETLREAYSKNAKKYRTFAESKIEATNKVKTSLESLKQSVASALQVKDIDKTQTITGQLGTQIDVLKTKIAAAGTFAQTSGAKATSALGKAALTTAKYSGKFAGLVANIRSADEPAVTFGSTASSAFDKLKTSISGASNKLSQLKADLKVGADINPFSDVPEDIEDMNRGITGFSNRFGKKMDSLKEKLNVGLVEPAKKAKVEYKDVARIVQGILISRVFYSGMNAIQQCTKAVWDFAKELEYAKIAYSNLFGNTELAEEFINVLKDFSATTPFSFEESEDAAKKLLAYGIQYKNVMYMMQGTLAASSMTADAQTIDSVSTALGQIYTKGRLMNEEMRQLAEAGIPAYEILQEKLGLTQEQLQNLGDQSISSSVAINALIDGMTERFGGVIASSSSTITGMLSNIKDNAIMLGASIFNPIIEKLRGFISYLDTSFKELRSIADNSGLGGVFEHIVPEAYQQEARRFLANLLNLIKVVVNLGKAISGFLSPVLQALVRVFNAFAPTLNIILNLLADLIHYVTSNAKLMQILTSLLVAAASAFILYKVKGYATLIVAKVIKFTTSAVETLCIALLVLLDHPIWVALGAAVVLIATLTGTFNKLGTAISSFWDKLTNISGTNPDDILLPESKERASDLDKFNEALSDTSDNMDELADSTGSAATAAKSLLAFDEVFNLDDPDENISTDDTSSVDDYFDPSDLSVPDYSGIDSEDFLPDESDLDFGSYASNLVNAFTDALKEKLAAAGFTIKDLIAGALIIIIAGAIGLAIAGVSGGLIGVAIGALVAALILSFKHGVETGDWFAFAAVLVTAIAGAVMMLTTGSASVLAVAIGALVLWFIVELKKGFETGDYTGLSYPIIAGIAAAVVFITSSAAVGALAIAVAGLAIWLISSIHTALETGDWSGTAYPIAASLGGVIGFLIGGPAGALIGIGAGLLVSGLYNLIHTKLEEHGVEPLGTTLGDKILTILSLATLGPFGPLIAAAAKSLVLKVYEKIKTAWGEEKLDWEQMDLEEKIAKVFSLLASTTPVGIIGKAISKLIKAILEKFGIDWADVETFWGEKYEKAKTFVGTFISGILTTLGNAWTSISSWFENKIAELEAFAARIKAAVSLASSSGSTTRTVYTRSGDTTVGGSGGSFGTSRSSSSLWGKIKGKLTGHATGGIFNKEHIAQFAEGNKAEAIIPLENENAMRPFTDVVTKNILETILPIIAAKSTSTQIAAVSPSSQEDLRPLYVGTLVADDNGLKELERKMKIIRAKETRRS